MVRIRAGFSSELDLDVGLRLGFGIGVRFGSRFGMNKRPSMHAGGPVS